MTSKEEALVIFEQVQREGMSTDNCYSPCFKKHCIEIAINRAKASSKNNYEEVILEIKKLENV